MRGAFFLSFCYHLGNPFFRTLSNQSLPFLVLMIDTPIIPISAKKLITANPGVIVILFPPYCLL